MEKAAAVVKDDFHRIAVRGFSLHRFLVSLLSCRPTGYIDPGACLAYVELCAMHAEDGR